MYINTLMNKTKSELVGIILRKDDVETRLRAEIATLKRENKQLNKERNHTKRIKNDAWVKRMVHFIFGKISSGY